METKLTDEEWFDEYAKACKSLEDGYYEQLAYGGTSDAQTEKEIEFDRRLIEYVHLLQDENKRLTEDNELKTAQVSLLTGQVEYLKNCGDNFLSDCEKLQKQVDELKEQLEKAYKTERANIRAEIADAGTSCHWCERQTVKDTAKEICLKIIKDQPQPIKEKWVEWFKKEYGVEVE